MDASARHPQDVLAWHGAAALCMGLMLLAVQPTWFAGVGVGLFVAGLGWCGVQLARRTAPAPYLRLGICSVAMVMMFVQNGAHASHGGHDMVMPLPGPSPLAVGLAVALVVVAGLAARPLLVRDMRVGPRSAALGETVLSALMAAMLVGLV